MHQEITARRGVRVMREAERIWRRRGVKWREARTRVSNTPPLRYIYLLLEHQRTIGHQIKDRTVKRIYARWLISPSLNSEDITVGNYE